MAKPPPAPPASDLDGVDEDEVRNTDAARESGQGGEDLARARDEAAAKPDYSEDRGERRSRDDRSR